MGVGGTSCEVRPRLGWIDTPKYHMIMTTKGLRSLWRCARESAWGEGESPAAELVDLGGGKGQESIGFFRVVKRTIGVRILGRSKTL